MYYRIVFFDRNGKAEKVEIRKADEVSIEALFAENRFIEIYKCNAKGNNYTHRRVCPNQQSR